jgi:hypothetical protein
MTTITPQLPSLVLAGELTYGRYASERRMSNVKSWFIGDTDLHAALYDWFTRPDATPIQRLTIRQLRRQAQDVFQGEARVWVAGRTLTQYPPMYRWRADECLIGERDLGLSLLAFQGEDIQITLLDVFVPAHARPILWDDEPEELV